jgi:LuxR family transcriptional regulator, maltose regulon positive regulatory protein
MPRRADMPGPLAATKVAAPGLPEGSIMRPRLHARLDAGVEGPLTLVIGPAGSGKTVLLSSWAATREADPRIAWLSLDAADGSPRRFWAGVLQALRAAGVGEPIRSLEVPPREGSHAIVPALVAGLARRSEPVVLVLDDFHEVSHQVAGQLEPLLRHPSPALRLVIAARKDPPFRVGRMRLSDEVTELRAADLACTEEEAGALLETAGVRLSSSAIGRLWVRTEGWLAGLRLAAVSLHGHEASAAFLDEFTGEAAIVSDYLVAEVLARQPEEIRDFLLRTSICDTLDGDLADVLSGSGGGHATLAALARDGVFLAPVDRRAQWYRYHALFAEVLRAELRWRMPDQVRGLHARAAAWFAAQGDDPGAVRHAIAGEDWDLATRVAAERWLDLLLRNELETLDPLLRRIPAGRERDAELALALAAVHLERAEIAAAERQLATATANARRVPAGRRAHFALSLAAARLHLARLHGDVGDAAAAAEELLGLEGEAGVVGAELRSMALANVGISKLWTGDAAGAALDLERAARAADEADSPWLELVALAHLAVAATRAGDLRTGARRARDAVTIAERRGWTALSAAGLAYGVLLLEATHQYRLTDAAPLHDRAALALHGARERPARVCGAVPRARYLLTAGRVEDALDVARAGLEDADGWPLDQTVLSTLHELEGRALAALGERAVARETLEQALHDAPRSPQLMAALGRLQVADGEPEPARETVVPGLGAASGTASVPTAELWLVEALALDALADHQGAATALEQALDRIEPAGLLQVLVAQGGPMRPLLRRHLRTETAHHALVERALQALEDRTADHLPAIGPSEVLTDRERQVLRYLPTNLSNQQIAGELFVSLNTVKSHVKAIYRKLDVDGRGEAVRRARDLRLLAP